MMCVVFFPARARNACVEGVSHSSSMSHDVASGSRKIMSRKVRTTNLVPQLPTALGGEVEELRRAVDNARK